MSVTLMKKRAPRTRRSGFTLLELLVMMVMFSVVMGGVMTMLTRQQRFYGGIGDVIQTRAQVRQALGLLPGELRALSPSQNDIYAMTDSSIEFRAITGSSILCYKSSSTEYILPPLSLARGNTLTTWVVKPVVGDSVLVFDDSLSTSLSDDAWRPRRITAMSEPTGSSGCAYWTRYTVSADGTKPSYKIKLSSEVKNVKTGAPIRFFRKVHYSFYKTPSGKWFLGYYDCVPTAVPNCGTIQPVSGPYRPYAPAAAGTSGLTFAYYDSTGAPTTVKTNVARIDIVVRGESTRPIWGSALFSDSIAMSIGVRNRN
jgi:type II secretory pathway pseudopilin PulG